MSVNVTVIGSKPESDEYQGALKLKSIIERDMPASAVGEIILHANVTLFGQVVKDVDLLMMGTISNYCPKLKFNKDNSEVCEEVSVNSFCTVIEIKSHDVSGVFREGTEIYVRYGAGSHSVTTQSNEQKISAKRFFDKAIGFSPFITNLIWFTNISREEIDNLLTIESKKMSANVIGNDFSLKDVMQLLALQRPPKFYQRRYNLDSGYAGKSLEDLQKVFKLFSKAKTSMGYLTRNRIEQITVKNVGNNFDIKNTENMSLLRGRAGTGKTVGLIQNAIRLVDEQAVRVIILTYNKALVSDIRRLFALAELPDMFQEQCVAINTMQSFFYKIINYVLFDGKLDGEEYIEKYDQYLCELLEFIKDDEGKQCVKDICGRDCLLDWDYCMLDEAQDWTTKERDIILNLYDSSQIVVADGGNQFVRKVSPCDWNVVKNRTNIKLKYCLRQKSNLISFINHFSSMITSSSNRIISSEKMIGGKVILLSNENEVYKLYKKELKQVKKAGNIPYDMMILVPHQMVEKTNDGRKFKYLKEYEKRGIFVWDGTAEDIRSGFSPLGDEIRLYQYESARGLEAWTVFCLEFDQYLDNKLKEYCPDDNKNSLLLESDEEKRMKYLLNWALVPLTRAIDTLVITVKDSNSKWSQLLFDLQKECGDYVVYEQEG